jgi:formate dehydrogenase subunit gamma
MSVFIQRYTARERSNHWVVAIAFVLAALSGLALFHPAFFFLRCRVKA